MTLCGSFVPNACATQLLLGNFSPDSATTIVRTGAENDGPFAYYFVDNILLALAREVPGCIDPCHDSVSFAEALQAPAEE